MLSGFDCEEEVLHMIAVGDDQVVSLEAFVNGSSLTGA